MRSSIMGCLLLASATSSLAQELSVEDRTCITAAAGRLPTIAALKIEASRAVEQPQAPGRGQRNVYRVLVEIDVIVAEQRSTYVFNCILDGQLTVVQPLGMR